MRVRRKYYRDIWPEYYTASIPFRLNILYHCGFSLLVLLITQITRGLALAIFYKNNGFDSFFALIEQTQESKTYWLLRAYHSNTARAIFIALYLHIYRSLVYKTYTTHRGHSYAWAIGVTLFILIIATAFLGYVLPWGQISFWGATVITRFLGVLPFGETLELLVWGRHSVDNNLVSRIFTLHYLLPFLLVAGTSMHLEGLHIKGSTCCVGTSMPERYSFFFYFLRRDIWFIFVVQGFILFLVFWNPGFFGDPENWVEARRLKTPRNIKPEWYFLPFYAILRSIPNKVGGIVLIAMAILVLYPLAWVKKKSPIKKFCLAIFTLSFISLGILGGIHVNVYTGEVGIIMTIIYFFFFFLNVY